MKKLTLLLRMSHSDLRTRRPALLSVVVFVRVLIGLAASFANICGAIGINTEATENQFIVTTWKTEQGLPQNRIECLLQSRDGYLWIGTGVGLARFDGVRFTTYNRANTPAFEREVCKALAEDREGNLWIGTKSGLLRRQQGAFRRFDTSDGLCHDEVTAFAISQRGGLWIGTGGGVSYFANGRFTNYVNESLSRKHVYSLCEDRAGILWVGFPTGLFKLDPATGTYERVWWTPGVLPHMNDDIVSAVYQGQDNRIWIGTYHGIYRISGEETARYRIDNRDDNGEVRSIWEDDAGQIQVLSERGWSRFEPEQFVPVRLPDNLQEDSLRSIYKDREGNLWIGTTLGGLKRLRPKVLRTYSTKDGLLHNDVWSVSEGKDGAVWVGSSGGVSQVKNGEAKARQDLTRSVKAPPTVRSIIEDRFGGVWLGTAFANAWHLQQTNKIWQRGWNDALNNQSTAIFEDRSGAIWIGTRGGLTRALPVHGGNYEDDQWVANTHDEQWVYRTNEVLRVLRYYHWQYRSGMWEFHGTNTAHHGNGDDIIGPRLDGAQLKEATWTTNLIQGELSHPEVRAILEDRTGTLWFATGGGLNKIQDGKFTSLTTKDGLIDDVTWGLHEDTDGALWIATRAGLSRLKNGRFSNFTAEHGLFDTVVNQILEDDFGYLWMGCKRGIFRVSRKALDDVAEGRASSVNCISLGEADGMLASETNGQVQPAGCKTKDGKLWFPTVQGVVVVAPALVQLNSVVPPVTIEEVRVNDSIAFKDERIVSDKSGLTSALAQSMVHDRKSEMVLPSGSGTLVEFEYTTLSLAAPEKVRFKYRLDGHDSAWRFVETRTARFTNLRPGHYRFSVTGCNNHGLWNEDGASIGFYVAPYFYQTKWFPAACGLATIVLGYSLRAWTARRQRQMQQLKSQLMLEQERARIAQDIHDDLGAHLTHIGVLAELANRSLEPQNRAAGHVQKIAAATGESSRSLDEIVWALNPQNDSLRSLVAYLRNYTSEYLTAANIQCDFDAPEELPSCTIAAQVRHHIFLILKESLHNTVQHAQSTWVSIKLSLEGSGMTVELHDNGRGFDCDVAGRLASGNGLSNMITRASAIGGRVIVRSQPGNGTTVKLSVPLNAV
jgi:ligand-binding sensor domain-containing protein/signal transduction histidine kinase